jgi:hypothetical protein
MAAVPLPIETALVMIEGILIPQRERRLKLSAVDSCDSLASGHRGAAEHATVE